MRADRAIRFLKLKTNCADLRLPCDLLTALQHIFGLAVHGGRAGGAAAQPKTSRELAVTPLAFPTIASPRPIAVLFIFVAAFNTMEGKLTVIPVGALMLLLNVVGMHNAQWFMEKVGMTPLLVLGAVFGVLQVALGVEMVVDGYNALALS